MKRSTRSGVEDRWHRDPRKGEQVPFPADNPGPGCWCLDTRHGEPGKIVTTARHGQGKRWLARWVDHDGNEASKSFDRRAEAERHIRSVVTSMDTGTYSNPRRSGETFGTIAEAWHKTKAGRAPKTVAGYRGLLDVVILPKWENERLRDVDHEALQEWFTWLATAPAARKHAKRDAEGKVMETGLSPATLINTHRVVTQIFSYAIRCKYVAVNPANHIELPSRPQSRGLALTHEQVRQLAGHTAAAAVATRYRADTARAKTSPEGLATMVRLLAYGGLRIGECVALKVGDVDIENRRVTVNKAVTRVRGQGPVLGDTKTHQARRVPILTTELLDGLKLATDGRDPGEYLFPGPNGMMSEAWFSQRFTRAVAALGIPGVTVHTLRHTAGSLALSEGASVVTVQKLLGHRNATTTMNVYSHMLPDDFDNLAAAMDKAVQSA